MSGAGGLSLPDPALASQHGSSAPVGSSGDCLQAACGAHPAGHHSLQPPALQRPPAQHHLHTQRSAPQAAYLQAVHKRALRVSGLVGG